MPLHHTVLHLSAVPLGAHSQRPGEDLSAYPVIKLIIGLKRQDAQRQKRLGILCLFVNLSGIRHLLAVSLSFLPSLGFTYLQLPSNSASTHSSSDSLINTVNICSVFAHLQNTMPASETGNRWSSIGWISMLPSLRTGSACSCHGCRATEWFLLPCSGGAGSCVKAWAGPHKRPYQMKNRVFTLLCSIR